MCRFGRVISLVASAALAAVGEFIEYQYRDALAMEELVLPPLPPPEAIPLRFRSASYGNLGGRRRNRDRFKYTLCIEEEI